MSSSQLSAKEVRLVVAQALLFAIITATCVVWPEYCYTHLANFIQKNNPFQVDSSGINQGNTGNIVMQWFVASSLYNIITICFVFIGIYQRSRKQIQIPGDHGLTGVLGIALPICIGLLWWGVTRGQNLWVAGIFAIVAAIYSISDVMGLVAAGSATQRAELNPQLIQQTKYKYKQALALDLPNLAFHLLAIMLIKWTNHQEHHEFSAGISAGGFMLVNLAYAFQPLVRF